MPMQFSSSLTWKNNNLTNWIPSRHINTLFVLLCLEDKWREHNQDVDSERWTLPDPALFSAVWSGLGRVRENPRAQSKRRKPADGLLCTSLVFTVLWQEAGTAKYTPVPSLICRTGTLVEVAVIPTVTWGSSVACHGFHNGKGKYPQEMLNKFLNCDCISQNPVAKDRNLIPTQGEKGGIYRWSK